MKVFVCCFFVAVVFLSCNPTGISDGIAQRISISFDASYTGLGVSQAKSAKISSVSTSPLHDESFFKEDRQAENRGNLISQVTPQYFVLEIGQLLIYKAMENMEYSEFITQGVLNPRTNPLDHDIPRHINIVHARHFIRDVEILYGIEFGSIEFGDFWSGLMMRISPYAGTESNDGFYIMSLVGIDLGPEYMLTTLPNEITDQMDAPIEGLHYFSVGTLQPYITPTLSFITIGNDILTSGIQNPNGESGRWVLPGGATSGNSSQIFLPGNEIDLSSYDNPEITLVWDLYNLVEVYDAGTPSTVDDIVTFNLSNPFPVRLDVQEYRPQEQIGDPDDSTPPGDVSLLAIAGANTYNTLQWINPIDEDFDSVTIVRKAAAPPIDRNDGELVYQGFEPNYCDTTAVSGTHYYYLIQAVDFAGNFSPGVFLDQVQH